MRLLEICKKIIKYSENGDPVKDVIEKTDYTEDKLLVELAEFYVSKGGK